MTILLITAILQIGPVNPKVHGPVALHFGRHYHPSPMSQPYFGYPPSRIFGFATAWGEMAIV